MKKTVSLFLVLIMCLSILPTPASAAENIADENPQFYTTTKVFDSEEEYQEYLRNEPSPALDLDPLFTFYIVRRGSTSTRCGVYVRFTGTKLVSRVRFYKILVGDADNSTVYDTICHTNGTYVYCDIPAAMVGSILLGMVDVPLNVDEVRITKSIFQVLTLDTGLWSNTTVGTGKFTIN